MRIVIVCSVIFVLGSIFYSIATNVDNIGSVLKAANSDPDSVETVETVETEIAENEHSTTQQAQAVHGDEAPESTEKGILIKDDYFVNDLIQPDVSESKLKIAHADKIDISFFKHLVSIPEMVLITGGEFLMGARDHEYYAHHSESPVHVVQLSDFYISKNVVTIGEYREFDSDNYMHSGRYSHEELPAIFSSTEAYEYIKWLSDNTGEKYRIPSESEWEYMARAGTDTPFYTGDCIDVKQANFDPSKDVLGNCKLSKYRRSFGIFMVSDIDAENPWGIRHALGNTWELTEDCWHDNYVNAPVDGSAWKDEDDGDCAFRVFRGGSWSSGMSGIRSSARFKVSIDRMKFAMRIVKDAE